ncbi:MAG TPA: AraC family transcriptional regulator [Paraburkholderia sp.]|nr:AraC family transcriptional regulator [Paraburkholderia sp.]
MTGTEASRLRASTAGIPVIERFAFWREAICEVYVGIDPELPGDLAFEGSFEAPAFGDAKIGRIIAPGHRASRHAKAMRKTPDDSVFINYCESSDYQAEDHLGGLLVPRGTPRLLDNAAGFTVHFPERRPMTLHSVRLPREMFGSRPNFCAANGALTDSALGRLIAEQFRLLAQAMYMQTPLVVAALARSLETLVPALVQDVSQCVREQRKPETALDHLKNYACARLAEPGLSPATIADAFHCTSRTVQNRFAEAGETFSSWLMEERLAKALSMLREPLHTQRSVEWISYRCGFAASAHFHRAFKARFGMTPGTVRTQTSIEGIQESF